MTKEYQGEVKSVSDALAHLIELEETEFVRSAYRKTVSRFPFGIWFRGHFDSDWKLQPKVFRERTGVPGRRRSGLSVFDETNLIAHSRVRLAESFRSQPTTFDWLCTLQHYDVPTRLLDWSESLLVALYFAVRGSQENHHTSKESDADLIALNAIRLNSMTINKNEIRTSDTYDVIARAALGEARSKREHRESTVRATTQHLDRIALKHR